MLNQIKILSMMQLCNLFAVNEMRYTKDKKKKGRALGILAVWFMLAVMLIFYVAALTKGFILVGMQEMVPAYLAAVTSILVFIFTFFKAAAVIFETKAYELLISLPLSKTAIVVSRFATMYVTNFLLCTLVMVSGITVYGYYVQPGAFFYLYAILGTVLLPLLPITGATAVGGLITAISARMKHKSMAASFLTILLALVTIVAATLFGGGAEEYNKEMLKNLGTVMMNQIENIYPPAIWFGNAAVGKSFLSFLLFAGSSVLIFVLVVFVLSKWYLTICTFLNATSAKNNYQMQHLSTNSVRTALWKKDLRRYFASSIYVTNTMLGYMLMVLAAVSLAVAGKEKIEEVMKLPGILEKVLPFVLSAMPVMMPTTACSVSLEGKQWWITQTLPLRMKEVLDAKILVNLTVAFPFYVVSAIICTVALKPSVSESVWIFILPAAYILFSAVAGISVNLAVPVFDWENEVTVVKQGAGTLLIMLIGMVSIVLPVAGMFLIKGISEDVRKLLTVFVLLILTAFLYCSNLRKDITKIGG